MINEEGVSNILVHSIMILPDICAYYESLKRLFAYCYEIGFLECTEIHFSIFDQQVHLSRGQGNVCLFSGSL